MSAINQTFDLEPYFEEIKERYLYKNESLNELMQWMHVKYNLPKSKKRYETVLKGWKLQKNLTPHGWQVVGHIIEKRSNKPTVVYFCGRKIDPKKVKKEIQRHKPPPSLLRIEDELNLVNAPLPENVWIRSPSPDLVSSTCTQIRYHSNLFRCLQTLPSIQLKFALDKILASRSESVSLNHDSQITTTSRSNAQAIDAQVEIEEPALTDLVDIVLSRKMKQGYYSLNIITSSFPLIVLVNIFKDFIMEVSNGERNFSFHKTSPTPEHFLSNPLAFIVQWIIRSDTLRYLKAIFDCLKTNPAIKIFYQSLLFAAIQLSNVGLVEFLLDMKYIDLNTRLHGATLLQRASQFGSCSIVRQLIDRGASIDLAYHVPPYYGKTPLSIAARYGSLRICQFLLRRGADPHGISTVSLTRQVWGYRASRFDLGEAYRPTHRQFWSPIQCAAYSGHIQILGLLLKYGANLRTEMPTQGLCDTPLMIAGTFRHMPMYKLILYLYQLQNTHPSAVEAIAGLVLAMEMQDTQLVDQLLPFSDLALVTRKTNIAAVQQIILNSRYTLVRSDDLKTHWYSSFQQAIKARNEYFLKDLLDQNVDISTYPGREKHAIMHSAVKSSAVLEHFIKRDILRHASPSVLKRVLKAHMGNKIFPGLISYLKTANILRADWMEITLRSLSKFAKQGFRTDYREHINYLNYSTTLQYLISVTHSGSSCKNLDCAKIIALISDLSYLHLDEPHSQYVWELVIALLKQHPDIDLSDSSILTWSIRRSYNDRNTSFMLIDRKIGINQTNLNIPTPLIAILRNGSCLAPQLVQILLKKGTDVNPIHPKKCPAARTDFCWFDHPITVAASICDIAMIDLLLKHGAKINPQPGNYTHQRYPSNPIAAVLDSPVGALCEVVSEQEQLDTIEFLLSKGADVNYPASYRFQRTPLQTAVDAKCYSWKCFKLLLDSGADVSGQAAPSRGGTALQFACKRGRIDAVLELLHRGADVNEPPSPRHGRTALEAAAEHGRLDIVQLLLNRGADVRCRAIVFADKAGHNIIGELIEKRKADTHFVDELLEPYAYSDQIGGDCLSELNDCSDISSVDNVPSDHSSSYNSTEPMSDEPSNVSCANARDGQIQIVHEGRFDKVETENLFCVDDSCPIVERVPHRHLSDEEARHDQNFEEFIDLNAYNERRLVELKEDSELITADDPVSTSCSTSTMSHNVLDWLEDIDDLSFNVNNDVEHLLLPVSNRDNHHTVEDSINIDQPSSLIDANIKSCKVVLHLESDNSHNPHSTSKNQASVQVQETEVQEDPMIKSPNNFINDFFSYDQFLDIVDFDL